MNIYCIQFFIETKRISEHWIEIWIVSWRTDIQTLYYSALVGRWVLSFVSVIRKLLTIEEESLLHCCEAVAWGPGDRTRLTSSLFIGSSDTVWLPSHTNISDRSDIDPLITTIFLAWGGINQKRCRGVFNNNKDGCRCVNWSWRVGVEPGQTNDRDERERTETWYQVASFLLKSCSLELIGSQTTHHYSTSLSSRTNSSLPPPILNTWST